MSKGINVRIDVNKIHYYAACNGFSESQMLKAAGCSADILSRARKNNGIVTARTLKRITEFLEISPGEIIINEEATTCRG